MMENRRTHMVYLNFAVTFISQILQVLMGFVVRKIFINNLGLTYLGYNSVFSNLLQMLNLADLGIGVAITSFLFKPLAEKNRERIAALMYIYKKIYSIIGLIVLGIGVFISIFLEVLIPDATCSIGYLRLLFYINLSGTVSTYFLAYKRTLLIADQKSYIVNLIDGVMYFIVSILQIVSLFIVPNYLVYLILQIAKNIVSNLILSFKADKEFKGINKCTSVELINDYRPQIVKYVKDVFVSKIGSTIYYSTDNVIISMFQGSLLAGYLSNYTMITVQLTNVVNQILASLQATFGNYIYTISSKEKQRQMTNNYFCANFIIGNFCFLCFTILAEPFIKLFFGKNLVLGFSTALWLGINLMLTVMMQLPSQVFVIYKLFHYDKVIVAVSAVINIIVSSILVQIIGINGVLIGTFITSLIYLFSRFYIISKYVYQIKYTYYLKKILYYFMVSLVSFIGIAFSIYEIEGNNIYSFLIKTMFVGILAVVLPTAMLSVSDEFKYLIGKFFPAKIQRMCKPKIIYLVSGIFVIIVKLIGMQIL